MAASPDSAAAPTARRRKGLAQVLLLVAESGFVALILVEVLLRLTTQSVPALEPRRFALVDAHGVATPVRQMPVVDHALPPGATLRLSYDAAGAPDPNGRIVFLSIGMSNTSVSSPPVLPMPVWVASRTPMGSVLVTDRMPLASSTLDGVNARFNVVCSSGCRVSGSEGSALMP